MAYVNVAEWKTEQVCEWLKGLDNCIQHYIRAFAIQSIHGQNLLNFRPEDLENLGIYKIGHQEIILAAVDDLRNFHYELDRENLQLLALRLSCKAHSLCNELAQYSSSDKLITTQTLCDVASTITSVKPLVRWMDKPPFNGLLDYNEKKSRLLKLSLEMATCAQRDRFAEKPIEKIQMACKELSELADYIIQEAMDPMILQPATLDLATLKKPGDDLGFYILASSHAHQVTEIKFGSPAHQCGKMEEGDEIVQVNYQTVVGWERKKVLELFRENPDEIILTLKRRPRHTKVYGQIYIKPYRLPSNKKISYSRWHHNLPSPRPELLSIPDFVMPRPRHQTREPSPEPVSIIDTVDIPVITTDSSDSEDSESEPIITDRLYPSKPRNMIQRRATITGASPTAKYGIELEQFWRELKKEHKINFPILDKAMSCAQGLDDTPKVGIRSQTYIGSIGYESRMKKTSSTTYEKRKVKFNELENDNDKSKKVFEKNEVTKLEPETKSMTANESNSKLTENNEVEKIQNKCIKSLPLRTSEKPIHKIIEKFQTNIQEISGDKSLKTLEKSQHILDKFQNSTNKFQNSNDKFQNNVGRIHNTLEKLTISYDKISKSSSPVQHLDKTQRDKSPKPPEKPVSYLEKSAAFLEKSAGYVDKVQNVEETPNRLLMMKKNDKVFPEVEIVTIKRHENVENISENHKILQTFERSSKKIMSSFGGDTIKEATAQWYVYSHGQEAEKKLRLTPPEPPKRKYFSKSVVSSSDDEDKSLPKFPLRKLNNSHSNISNSSTSSSASNGALIDRHMWSRKPEKNCIMESLSEPRSSRPRTIQRTLLEQYKSMDDGQKHIGHSYKMDRFNTEPSLQIPVTLPRPSEFVSKLKVEEKDKSNEIGTMNRAISMARNITLHGSSVSYSKSPRSVRKRNTLLSKRRNVSVKELNPVDMEGWLIYRGKGAGGTWAKAWYVLKYAFLYRFSSQDSLKADCLICLTGYTASQATEIKSRKYAFKVYHTGTVFYFAADSEDMLSTWLDAVNKATLGIEASQGISELYSETDESDCEVKASSKKSKSAPPSAEKSGSSTSESGFGSLKKFVRRDGTSLDRKYLKFLGSKSRNYPVPTEQFRSYRRVLPSSSSSLNN